MTKFTPGQWFICRHDNRTTICVADGLGHREIATEPRGNGDHRADAHLIAAAPDLYAALETMERRYCAALDIIRTIGAGDPDDKNAGQPDPETSIAVQAARTALASARGET